MTYKTLSIRITWEDPDTGATVEVAREAPYSIRPSVNVIQRFAQDAATELDENIKGGAPTRFEVD
jgi:hypothetical protein